MSAEPEFRKQPGRHRPHLGALRQRRDGAALGARQGRLLVGSGDARSFQQPAGGQAVRPGRARRQFGPGDRRGRAHCRARSCRATSATTGAAPRTRKSARRAHRACAAARRVDGLPDPVGAVREVVAAAVGAAGAAVRHLRRAGRGVAARHDQRRLFPDRPGDAARPGGEERDPDRRVRVAEAPRRHERVGRGARSGATALPADPHDLAGLHPRRAAAGVFQRRRRRRRGSRSAPA